MAMSRPLSFRREMMVHTHTPICRRRRCLFSLESVIFLIVIDDVDKGDDDEMRDPGVCVLLLLLLLVLLQFVMLSTGKRQPL